MSLETHPVISICKKFGQPLVKPSMLVLCRIVAYSSGVLLASYIANVELGASVVMTVSVAALLFAFVLHRRRSTHEERTRRAARAREQAITIYATVSDTASTSFEFRYERGRGVAMGPFEFVGEATDVRAGDQVSIDGLCEIESVAALGYRGDGDETRAAFRSTALCPVRVQRLSWR